MASRRFPACEMVRFIGTQPVLGKAGRPISARYSALTAATPGAIYWRASTGSADGPGPPVVPSVRRTEGADEGVGTGEQVLERAVVVDQMVGGEAAFVPVPLRGEPRTGVVLGETPRHGALEVPRLSPIRRSDGSVWSTAG